MQDRIENFFEVGSNFEDDGSFGYFYLRFHRNACENDFSLMGSSEHGGRGNSMNFPWNLEMSVKLKYCQGVKNRTVSDCQTEVLPGSVKTKLLSVSITIKSTDRKCHDEDTSRECYKRNFNNGVQQSN